MELSHTFTTVQVKKDSRRKGDGHQNHDATILDRVSVWSPFAGRWKDGTMGTQNLQVQGLVITLWFFGWNTVNNI